MRLGRDDFSTVFMRKCKLFKVSGTYRFFHCLQTFGSGLVFEHFFIIRFIFWEELDEQYCYRRYNGQLVIVKMKCNSYA